MNGGRAHPPSKILIDFADVFKLLNNNYQMYENLDNFPPRVPGYGIQLSFRLNGRLPDLRLKIEPRHNSREKGAHK